MTNAAPTAPKRALARAVLIAISASPAGVGCGSASPAGPLPANQALATSAPGPSASASAPATTSAPASVAASAPASAGRAPTPASSPRRRAKLRYEAGELSFPAPLVDVVIGGYPTSMIVDTGASHHVVAEWLAREISLKTTDSGDHGIDHAGRALRIARLEGVSLAVSGWGPVDAPLMLVVALPDPLRMMGIGGILSPQHLAREGLATLLDLRAGSMSEETTDEAARRVEAAGGVKAIGGVRACGGANEGLVLLMEGTVEGQPALLKIDSGAERSSLLQTSPAGKAILGRASSKSTGYAANGKFTASMLEDAKLKVGDLDATVDLNLDPGRVAPACPSDGFLGMDVLRSCTLLVQGDKTQGRCQAR